MKHTILAVMLVSILAPSLFSANARRGAGKDMKYQEILPVNTDNGDDFNVGWSTQSWPLYVSSTAFTLLTTSTTYDTDRKYFTLASTSNQAIWISSSSVLMTGKNGIYYAFPLSTTTVTANFWTWSYSGHGPVYGRLDAGAAGPAAVYIFEQR